MSITHAQRIVTLRKELYDHSFRYYVGNCPSISDAEYDVLFQELAELEKLHPEMGDPNSPTRRIGSPVPTSLRKVKHKVKMLSLDNVTSLTKTLQFFDKYRGQEATIEMKIDGLSLHLRYEKGKLIQAVTRGDGYEGADVTENARTIRTIPLELRKPVTTEVRGEVYWRVSEFKKFNKTAKKAYANPRNGASGVLQQKDSKAVASCHLDFVAYSIPTDVPALVDTQEGMLAYLERLGFRSPMTLDVTQDMVGLPFVTTVIETRELEDAIKFLDNYRKSLDLDTDGLVIKLSSLAQQRDTGEGERAPKWAAAYKFPPETKVTRLLEITVQIGKTGQVSPVAALEPVSLGGAMVQRASLCNQAELNRLGIDIGDYVLVQRSGEVIPKVVGLSRPSPTKVNVNKSYLLPKTCPCCSTPLIQLEGKVHQYCPNTENCHDQIYARLVYATGDDGLDIDGLGEVGVKTLMDKAGVRKLSDIYALKDFSFFKPAQAKRVMTSLEVARTGSLWRKIAALSIEGIGKVSAQDLAAKYPSLAAMYDDKGLEEILGEVATASFNSWFSENLTEIELLHSLGFDFEQDARASGPLSGMTFCITGRMRSGPRDKVSDLVEAKGGIVKGAVTQKVKFLVQGDGGGQNKAGDAQKWGTQIITEEELYSMIGIPMPIYREVEAEVEP